MWMMAGVGLVRGGFGGLRRGWLVVVVATPLRVLAGVRPSEKDFDDGAASRRYWDDG